MDAKLKILLVEDNRIAQKVGKFNLEQLGCEVKLTSSGQEALESLKNNIYDIIFMDLGLGKEMDGYTVARKIRQGNSKNKNTLIIALTAHGREAILQDCLSAGMNEVLVKPLLIENAQDILITFFPEKFSLAK